MSAGQSGPGAAAVVWTEDYLDYRLGPEHPMNPLRLDLTMALAGELGVLSGIETLTPDAADDEMLLRIHTPGYLAAVKGAPEEVRAGHHVGHGMGTEDNPVFERMHEASALMAGGSVTAAREIASGRTRRAVTIGGGLHHATADSAAGFCVYNDAAIAISWLLDNGFDRIAYLDVDVHHGDGVQAAFYDDPRVLTVSLHQHPATLWPGTGWAKELGAAGAEGSSVNLPLMPGTADAAWLRAFHAVVPSVVRAHRPQLIVSQCGVDTHRLDPLADLRLTVDGHRAAFQAIRALAEELTDGRWLAMGGGGYGLVRVVPRSWTHLIAAVLDRDVDPATSLPPLWYTRAVELIGHAAVPTTMGDDGDVAWVAWDGGGAPDPHSERTHRDRLASVDAAILTTRRAVLPLHGLDPDDPRD